MPTQLETAAQALEAGLAKLRSTAAASAEMTPVQIDEAFAPITALLATLTTRMVDVDDAIARAQRRKGVHPAGIFAADLAKHGAEYLKHLTVDENNKALVGPRINDIVEAATGLSLLDKHTRGIFQASGG